MSVTICDSGACLCGDVTFEVNGTILLNALCHCRSCARAVGMSPVHLMAVSPPSAIKVTHGQLKIVNGYGSMKHVMCSKCGVKIYQYPEGAEFRALFPTNFRIEDGLSCILPDNYKPTVHLNYENRHYDWSDELPKFKCMPPDGKVDNKGNDIA